MDRLTPKPSPFGYSDFNPFVAMVGSRPFLERLPPEHTSAGPMYSPFQAPSYGTFLDSLWRVDILSCTGDASLKKRPRPTTGAFPFGTMDTRPVAVTRLVVGGLWFLTWVSGHSSKPNDTGDNPLSLCVI
jgi:hypothetical protein